MTPADTALAFCRECLGWLDVPSYDITGGVAFCFTDLTTVLTAVRTWCDANGSTLVITSQRPPKFFRWRVQVSEHGYVLDNDLCQALLTACLEAARRIKAA